MDLVKKGLLNTLSTPNLNLPSFKGRPIKLDNKLFPIVITKKGEKHTQFSHQGRNDYDNERDLIAREK